MTSNPYSNETFFSFIWLFFKRLYLLASHQLSWHDLVSDEIQIFTLSLTACSCALLGAFLVLRKMTMVANALSHTILLGIASVYLLTKCFFGSQGCNPLSFMPLFMIASLLSALLTAFLTEFLTKTVHVQEDASIGVVFTSLFALGIVLVTLFTRNTHIGTEAIMGNADVLNFSDLFSVFIVLFINLFTFRLFFKEFKLTTFDPQLAIALGFSPTLFNYLLMTLVSLTVISSFKAIGILLVLSFITAPVLIARPFNHTLKSLIISASLIGMTACLLGVALSRHLLNSYSLALSTGGIVVSLLAFFYVLSLVILEIIDFLQKSLCLRKWNI